MKRGYRIRQRRHFFQLSQLALVCHLLILLQVPNQPANSMMTFRSRILWPQSRWNCLTSVGMWYDWKRATKWTEAQALSPLYHHHEKKEEGEMSLVYPSSSFMCISMVT